PTRYFVLLVSLQPAPRPISLHAWRAPRPVEGSAVKARRSSGSLALAGGEPGGADALAARARQGGIQTGRLGHRCRTGRCSQYPHDQEVRAGPYRRIFTHPGDVDDQLRIGRPDAATDGRCGPLLLRLVLRLAAGISRNLGRAD